MKESLILILFLILQLSCKYSSNKENKLNTKNQNYIDSSFSYNDTLKHLTESPDSILFTLNKIKSHLHLINSDYNNICQFLLLNNNESESEEVGYILFQYFNENIPVNKDFSFYLTRKGNKFKEDILSRLIKIISIDLQDNDYTYEKLIAKFKIFKGSVSAKKSFYNCMRDTIN